MSAKVNSGEKGCDYWLLRTTSMWALADRYVCINLLERDDRLEHAKQRFAAVGLAEQITFHRVKRDARGGRYGCYESHRSVIEKAYKDGINSVLIFEDDVLFNEGWEKVVEDAKAFIDSKIPFDTLFLGSKILFVDEQTTPNIWRVKCFEAHAYIVSRSGMQAYLDGRDEFDRELAEQGQDFIQNSLWQAMYSHCSPSICQDDALGTDHIWIDIIPAAYAVWFQMVVVPKYGSMIRPLICTKWWQQSWFGRRYIFGVGHYVIDDGRVRLQGLWLADTIFMVLLMLVSKPPYGLFRFLYDILRSATVYIPSRLRAYYRPVDQASSRDL